MKTKAFVFLCLLTGGCASFQFPPVFRYEEIQTDTFKLATFEKDIPTGEKAVQNSPVHIYIEGDGHSFNRRGYPTADPTPRRSFLRKIASQDKAPSVLYIGRPCQFVKDPLCREKDWTTARFSKQVIDAAAETIIRKSENRPVILIGYSGGGAVAGLVAVLHPEINVRKIITISGNMNHKQWTDEKNLYPLSDSLDVADYKTQFGKFPQYHYVGENDSVVPPHLIRSVVDNPELIEVVPNASHGRGFDKILPTFYKQIEK